MARTDTLTHFLTDIASAIRKKKGSNSTISAADFDTEINNIASPANLKFTSYNCSVYPETVDFSWLNTKNYTDMSYMFNDTQIENIIADFDLTNTTTCQLMFGGYNSQNQKLETVKFKGRNCQNLTSISGLGYGNSKLKKIDVEFENVTHLTDVSNLISMYSSPLEELKFKLTNSNLLTKTNFLSVSGGNSTLKKINIDISGMDSVTNIDGLGGYATTNIEEYSVNIHDTDFTNLVSVKNLGQIRSLNVTELDFSWLYTPNVTDMSYSFSAAGLERLDIRNVDFSNVTTTTGMFSNSSATTPTNCLIIVKDQAAKTWLATNFSSYTNVKTVDELGGNE